MSKAESRRNDEGRSLKRPSVAGRGASEFGILWEFGFRISDFIRSVRTRFSTILFPTLTLLQLSAAPLTPSWEHPPHQQREGMFWREHWYERGLTNANPAYERRFRINSPEASLHPSFGQRVEARENGLMLIKAEENLFQLAGAELYVELWGGHPGTANKRVTVNGRATYQLPRVGTEEGHCTYQYPVLPLTRSDLVNGYNAFQWALDQGTTFWGHALIDNACLRVALTNGQPDLVKLGLADLAASVVALKSSTAESATRSTLPHSDASTSETMLLRLDAPAKFRERIARVDYQAWHSGYDENGNRRATDWHGFTKDRWPVAWAGSSPSPLGGARAGVRGEGIENFPASWDTSMLPAQKNVAVRAFIRFKDAPGLVYVTAATPNLVIPDRPGAAVHLYVPADLPEGFWSRANNKKTCTIILEVDPAKIERAELYVVTWTGGAGGVKDYFTLNGRAFPVADGSRHVIQYNRLPVEPSLLRKGVNTIELLSDTEHHGIEIIYPGPALMVRYKVP